MYYRNDENILELLAPHDFIPIDDIKEESKKPQKKGRFIRRRKKRFKRSNEKPSSSDKAIIMLENIANQNTITKSQKKQFTRYQHSLKIPNQIIAPRPFIIHGKKRGAPGFHRQPLIKKYGKIQMVISGRVLITLDEDVFLALSRLAQMYKNVVFLTSVNEIIRTMYKKVAWDTQEAVRKSLKRLYGAEIGIMEKEYTDGELEEKSYNFRIIDEYALETKEQGKTQISLNDFFRRIFTDGFDTYIDSRLRANLKGDIAKALYMYLQRNRRERKPYSIGLYKLCEYINLQTEGLFPFQLRQKIRNGLQVLKDNGHLSSYKLDKKNDKVSVTYAKQEKVKDNKSTSQAKKDDTNPVLTKMFMKLIEGELNEKQKTILIDGISTIVKFQKNIPKRTFEIPEVRSEFGTASATCKCYIEWIEEQDWIDNIHVGIINDNNDVFRKFVKEYEDDYTYFGDYTLIQKKPK